MMHETIERFAGGLHEAATPALAWTTTALYLTTMLLASMLIRTRVRRARLRLAFRSALVWSGVVLTIFALSVDQHAKFSRRVLAQIRDTAHASGWYEHRYAIQIVAGLILAAVGAFVIRRFAVRRGHTVPGYRMFGLGILALVLFVSLRELSLHHIDNVMGYRVATLSVGRVGEAMILLAMTTGAARWARHTTQAA